MGELLHPVPLAAVVVLVVNDHLLKGAGLLPGWLTGKLSDLAGLLFFPLFLTAAATALRWLAGRRDARLTPRALHLALAATGLVFASIKLSPAVAAAVGALPDRTDLVALVMLVPAWALGRAELARRARDKTAS
jgi:hypothetical protein